MKDHGAEIVVGIMGAMQEEVHCITELMTSLKEIEWGKRVYYTGRIKGIKTVVVFSRWGKVAAATTVTTLIHHFKITELIFTGVAGAIHPDLNIGDVVIGDRFFQHDMDARPLMKQFEIPLLGVMGFKSDRVKVKRAKEIVSSLFERKHLETVINRNELNRFLINNPRCYVGDIASGDRFFSNIKDKHQLRRMLPTVLCVEMEGAAVAQVCYEYKIPFSIIRTISDGADENSEQDFSSFIKRISSKYALEIIKMFFQVH